MVVTLMTDATLWQQAGADKITHWQKLLKQAPHTHTRLARAAIAADTALTLRSAHTHRLERSFGKDWLATGDAVASFDPLSSLGIGFAIHSACHAALAVDHYLKTGKENALQHYHKGIVTQHADYLQHWRTFYAYERRFPEATFWQRSLQPR
jgi:flavin-dependent dehydrogenase